MPKYLVYTTDGYTEDLNGNETNKCQVLDIEVEANSAYEAIKQTHYLIPNWDITNIKAVEIK